MPMTTEVTKLSIRNVGEKEIHADTFHHILFGGDQLTAKRARGSQQLSKRKRYNRRALTSYRIVGNFRIVQIFT